MPSPEQQLYQADLARIHVDGYSFHWEGAAPSLLEWLRDAKVPRGGRVVDLGCGGGQWLAMLQRKGYLACGVDISPEMIRIAERTAPGTELLCGSLDEVELRECDAVTSLGEPLNYLNSGPRMKRVFKRVYAALKPGGLFVFDVRTPPDGPQPPVDRVRSGDDWFCHSRIEEDSRGVRRSITTFVADTEGRYRREEETHRLKLFRTEVMREWLTAIGFRARTRRGYGAYQLGKRQVVFLCRK